MKWLVKSSLASLLLTVLCLSYISQASASNSVSHTQGLLVSPATSFVSVNSGSTKSGSLLVADYTSQPIIVALEVKQFNVNNYSYSYTFSNASSNWIVLSKNQISLSPNQSQNIAYKINVPASASPGGYYLTLLASSVLGSGSIKGTAQVASLLYVTVNGKLNYNSTLKGYGMTGLSLNRNVNYHFNVLDTGNIYSFIYESAKINGLLGSNSTTPAAYLIMPGKIRSISGVIKTPIWPGLYRVTYGYTISNGTSHQISQEVIYTPAWFIALILIILLLANIYFGRKRDKKDKA